MARLIVTAALLALALGVGAFVHGDSTRPHASRAPARIDASKPGVLLRSEALAHAAPSGARVWRILYTTTRLDRRPVVASALVLAPTSAARTPAPVIAWAHATTGVASKCDPSLASEPLGAEGAPALAAILAHGWALVATDYAGFTASGPQPFLIGAAEAHAVLDAVRAARAIPTLRLQDRTVVWGHSQGGGAALWAGILAPRYAPGDHVVGVAALAPASALVPLTDSQSGSPIGAVIGIYTLSAYSAAYADVRFDRYVRPAARALAREIAERCLGGGLALVPRAAAPFFSRALTSGALGRRLAENTPAAHVAAPLLIAQGLSDELIPPALQQRFAAQLCAAGQRLEYRAYAGLNHVGLVLAPNSPLAADLLAWTEARFAGTPQPPGCTTISR